MSIDKDRIGELVLQHHKLVSQHHNMDVTLPTPNEVSKQLQGNFTEDQAADIAQYVYQPLRESLRELMLKGGVR